MILEVRDDDGVFVAVSVDVSEEDPDKETE